MNEYELSGIETIARGVVVSDGKILLCRPKGGSRSYLPGGHIEFGETGREALRREILEETGLESEIGEFLGVVESSFFQNGKKHCEINLVYKASISTPLVAAKEPWIEFVWCGLDRLGEANLLPEAFRVLGYNPDARFNA